VQRLRRRFVEEGLQAALSPYRTGTRLYQRKLDGAQEAKLFALACSSSVASRAAWVSWGQPTCDACQIWTERKPRPSGRSCRTTRLFSWTSSPWWIAPPQKQQ
jgi:hypothetical protein